MTADERYALKENIESARLAVKWVVDHAHRAHPYDAPYSLVALEHIEEALGILREADSR
jgi:hypothetical protein